MGKVVLIIFSAWLTACTAVRLVAPYDEFIYNGVSEYKDLLNKHVKDMADLSGTAEGTHEANKLKYNELEIKIESLIDRANLQSSGPGCSLSPTLADHIESQMGDNIPVELSAASVSTNANTYGCTQQLLILVKKQLVALEDIHRNIDKCMVVDDSIAVTFVTSPGPEMVTGTQGDIGRLIDSAIDEVNATLKETIRLAVVEKIEEAYTMIPGSIVEPQADSNMTEISCLRTITAQLALDISNQSINAAWVVENAKKNSGE